MALEFTKLSEVENIETPVAEATVIVEDNGSIKRTPMKNIGKVKSINGAEPDENGNVEVEIPEGFSGSWNDLSDKPFDESIEMVEVLSNDYHSIHSEDELEYLTYYYWHPFDEISHDMKSNCVYHVYINDVEYICTSSEVNEHMGEGDYQDITYIGNKHLYDEELYDDTEEPFVIRFSSSDYFAIYWKMDLGETIAIRVIEEKNVVHYLDNKFIKNSFFDINITNVTGEFNNRNNQCECTINKTFEEISEAYENGKTLRAIYTDKYEDTKILNMSSINSSNVVFSFYDSGEDKYILIIDNGDYCTFNLNRGVIGWNDLESKPFHTNYSDEYYGGVEYLEFEGTEYSECSTISEEMECYKGYYVELDYVTYNPSSSKDYSTNNIYLGDSELIEYPFYIQYNVEAGHVDMFKVSTDGSHTISIFYEVESGCSTLDSKYIGDDIARVNDVLNENGKLKKEVLPEGYPYKTVGEIYLLKEYNNPTPDDEHSDHYFFNEELVEGREYTIELNGTKYMRTACIGDENGIFLYLGNSSLYPSGGYFTPGENTEEPFLFVIGDGSLWIYLNEELSISESIISISYYGETIETIADEYLPDNIVRKYTNMIWMTSPNGSLFGVYVTNDGKLEVYQK